MSLALWALLVLAVQPTAGETSPLEVTGLRCEYQVDPLGVDVPAPRLTWRLGLSPGSSPTNPAAFEVQAAADREALAAGRTLVATGKRSSADPVSWIWSGPALGDLQRVVWRVRVWDRQGRPSAWSAPASFTTGVRRPADLPASWISVPDALRADGGAALTRGLPAVDEAVRELASMPYLRKSFELGESPVRAVAVVAGVGLHELRINGHPASDAVLGG